MSVNDAYDKDPGDKIEKDLKLQKEIEAQKFDELEPKEKPDIESESSSEGPEYAVQFIIFTWGRGAGKILTFLGCKI